MDKDEKAYLASIDEKLNILINLLMRKEEISIRDKVALCGNTSLSNKDASRIIGISETHYAKEKSLLKNKDVGKKSSKTEETNAEIENDQSETQSESKP